MSGYHTLTYYGGKRGYGKAEWISSLLPWDFNTAYLEPFAGMAGVLLARQRVCIEILNDLNGRVINWWRAVRDEPEQFGHLVENTPKSRDEFRWALTAMDDEEQSPLYRALAFHIIVSQSITNGDNVASDKQWARHFSPVIGSIPSYYGDEIARLAERLRSVQLESIDAFAILERVSGLPDMVVYCDPPYPTANRTSYLHHALDFSRLRELLIQQKGMVGISGYGDEWDSMGWHRYEKPALVRPRRGGTSDSRMEVLWVNDQAYERVNATRLI